MEKLQEKRIASVHRGAGPRRVKEAGTRSFDGPIPDLAVGKGARLARERVNRVGLEDALLATQASAG